MVAVPSAWSDYTKLTSSKAIPVTDIAGRRDCETSRFPHFLDNRLTVGGEVVSLRTGQPIFKPQEVHNNNNNNNNNNNSVAN
jgi:hypothetical protein